MKRLPILALAVVAIGSMSTSSHAFAPVHQNDQYEIRLQQFELFEYITPALTLTRERAARETVNQFGGKWGVYSWNSQAKSAQALIGSGYETGMRVDTEADAEFAGREVLGRNSVALGLDMDNMRFNKIGVGAGKVGVHFDQTFNGIPVVGGRAHAVFTETGRVFVMGADYYNGIELDVVPTLSTGAAERIAQAALPFNSVTDQVDGDAKLLVLPVPRSHEDVDFHLVWQVRVATQDPLGIWVTDVDAHSGEIVQRMNDIHFVDYSGTTVGDIQDITYCNGETDNAKHSYMEVKVTGGGSTTSDFDGNWTVPNGDNTVRTITSRFYGNYVNVNVSQSPPDATFSGSATPGVPFQIEWNDANSRQDERDVFQGVSDIHDLFEQFDPGWWRTNSRITANVNVNGSCNAYYNGSINFYPEVGNCANTGEIEGVVQHEFGHGVQAALIGGQGGQGLGEGNSDVLANILTQESIIGRGFNTGACAGGIRNSDNTKQYPGDLGGGVHSDGTIIAGFHWDAMEIFQDILGVEAGTLKLATDWHFARKVSTPQNQPLQVLAVFTADDDDGDLSNGTPFYDVYCRAAELHGYSCPLVTTGVLIVHDEELTKLAPNDHIVDADLLSTGGSITTATLHYRVNDGAWTTTTMDNVGGDSYEGVIPGLDHPDEIDYYLEVSDDTGITKLLPGLAPYELYDFDIAQSYSPMEGPSGWSVNDEGTDTAVQGAWENVIPVSSPIAPGEDTTPGSSNRCWVTLNGAPGGTSGQGDIDNGETSLYSPIYDMTGATVLKMQFEKWFRNDIGPSPDQDFFSVYVRNNGGSWIELDHSTTATDGWETFQYNIIAAIPVPENLEFKFIAEDALAFSYVDAAIDDFTLLGVLGDITGVETTGPVVSFALLGSSPNPAPGAAQIAYQVPVDAQVDLKIFDVSGREVRTLVDGNVNAGSHVADWDGMDQHGHAVASGVYYYRFGANEYVATGTMTLTR